MATFIGIFAIFGMYNAGNFISIAIVLFMVIIQEITDWSMKAQYRFNRSEGLSEKDSALAIHDLPSNINMISSLTIYGYGAYSLYFYIFK